MRTVFKAFFGLVVLGVAGLAAVTAFSDLPAPTREISAPVEVR